MRKQTLYIFLLLLQGIAFSQSPDEGIYFVKNGKIYSIDSSHPYTGQIDCILSQYDTHILPSIHRAIFDYSNWLWLSDWEKYDGNPPILIRAVGFVQNGEEVGKWEYYKESDHQLVVVGNFINGKMEGDWYGYNNDTLIFKKQYHKNKKKNVH